MGTAKDRKKELNWAVLGTGGIAGEMAKSLKAAGRQFYGVWNRTRKRAEDFAAAYGAERVYSKPEEVFEDPKVDGVYIAVLHDVHFPLIMEALEHGKHVLAEKPITLNSRQLKEAEKLAGEKGLILAEAMTIWHMPLYKELWKRLDQGEFGKAQIITANFGSFREYDMTSRFFSMDLSGGALLDIGVYAISAARSFMGGSPSGVKSHMRRAASGVDEQSVILMWNPEGQMASISLSLHSKQPKRVMISCEKAYIEIMDYPRGTKAVITDAQTGEKQEIEAGDEKTALFYEIQDMEEAVRNGDAGLMRLSWSHDVMQIMTDLRKEWKLLYPGEVW